MKGPTGGSTDGPTGPTGDDELPPALGALPELVREQVRPPTAAELNDGLRALFQRIGPMTTADGMRGVEVERGAFRSLLSTRWRTVAALSGAAAVIALAIGAVLVLGRGGAGFSPSGASTLTYQVEGGSVVAGGYLRQTGGSGVKLAFNEGSVLALMPGARGRLLSVNRTGVRLAVEQGTASFRITPNGRRLWLVDVGPFLVTVKGTVFTVAWDAASERFELRLRRGRVAVSGPLSSGDMELRAGQRLVVNLTRAETLITEEPPGDDIGDPHGPVASAPAPVVTPLGGDAVRAKAAPARASGGASISARAGRRGAVSGGASAATASSDSTGAAGGPRRWGQAMASGNWDRILEDADRSGLKATLDGASDEELIALANAARYRRRTELARDALGAERRRFPASPRALDVVYLLGRVEEGTAGGRLRGLAWYDEYLMRAPSGTYASEALGRKMTLTSELNGAARARLLAEEYLRRFPGGSYAGAAQALMRAP